MRQRTLFNEGWSFTKQAPEQNDWQAVTLPHTWNAIDGANGFAYDRGAYTYRNTFTISQLEQRNRQFIEFGAVNAVANVYLNGVHLGEHRGGYSMFRFELTNHLHYGMLNTLDVIVDNTALTDVYPQTADFTFFGGIYRDVHLVSVHPIHFDLMDYGSTGVYIDQHDVTEQKADLTVRTRLANQFEDAGKVRVWVSISKDGFPVTYAAQEVTLEGGEVKEVALPLRIMEPSRWDGPHDPQLYVAHVS
ncbi:MAG: sugar-binding domain-containing protein, partial [Exiguobacterium mexicanum]